MSESPELVSGSTLDFHGPMSTDRAARLIASLAAEQPRTIVDYGCGWADLLRRFAIACPDARAVGVDTYAPDVARGRAAVERDGLSDRVTLLEQPGAEYTEPADLVLCLGASQVFGPIPDALRQLRSRVAPGGRLLFADGYWERPPTDAELSHMWTDAAADDHTDLGTLVEQAEDAGFVTLAVESANRDEWEAFESGIIADRARWVATHAGHPDAETARAEVTAMRQRYLRGYRDILGYAFLTLAVPAG